MTTNKKSLIKEAEQNVLNHAKFITDMISVIDSMQYAIGDLASSKYSGRDEIAEGLQMVRTGLYREMQFTIAKAFAFVGVGGEEAEKYSREHARKVFGKGEVMSLLDKHLRMPSYWLSRECDDFAAEIEQALDKQEGEA